MAAVAVAITPRPQTTEDPEAILLVPDVDALTEGTVPGCGEDNPYN